ncbi:MAG: HAD family hydrolase [Actinomycetia bacterium]|nr:HAD family hydrolase [Actinomycetes bacterium]
MKKPDRAIFAAAAAATGASLDGAWMVGDSPLHDIVGAARLGVRTAWLHRGRSWNVQQTEPTVTIDSLGDLPNAISMIGPQTD